MTYNNIPTDDAGIHTEYEGQHMSALRWSIATVTMFIGIDAASATPPDSPIRIMAIEASQERIPNGVRIALDTDDVLDVDVESRLLASTQTISVARAGLSIFKPGALAKMSNASTEDQIEASKGSIVSVPVVHRISLPMGVYAEYVSITILRERLYPADYAIFRYFEVGANGIHELTVTEYSERVQPVVVYPDGTRMYTGGAAPITVSTKAVSTAMVVQREPFQPGGNNR